MLFLILWFLWSCISFRLLLVYLSHIWHVSKQMPHGSVYVWWISAIFKKLVDLIFKKDAIGNAQSIASMLNEKWLQDSKNQLEPGLDDIGAGTKAVLASSQVATEKTKLFWYKCKQIIIKIHIKLVERLPLQFSLVRVASSLDPQKMVQSSSTASLKFKKLADNLCTLNKISSKIVDNAKFEYDLFESVAVKNYSEVFVTYDPRKERLDVFLRKYVRPEFENFWHICKAVFVFSYSQSFVECDFQLTSWPLMTTCRRSELCHNGPVSEFTISGDLRKNCLLASQRYKRINSGKKNADISLNWSVKLQEIEVVNSKKAQQQESVDFLRKQVEAGMINADKNQDLSALSVATACLQDAKKKEKTACELEQALGHLKREYNQL